MTALQHHGHERIAGIPTEVGGVRFRSRLEARWSLMFDALGWGWEYEPVDLAGYVPDFVLLFHRPLYVEVKPGFSVPELRQMARKALAVFSAEDGRTPPGELLVLGATWDIVRDVPRTHGDHMDYEIGCLSNDDVALLFCCDTCGASVRAETCSWHCRRCGRHDGDGHFATFSDPIDEMLRTMWLQAGNAVQWNRR